MTTVRPKAAATPQETDSDMRKGGRQNCAAATAQYQPERTNEFSCELFRQWHLGSFSLLPGHKDTEPKINRIAGVVKPKAAPSALTQYATLPPRTERRCCPFWFATPIFCVSIKNNWSALNPYPPLATLQVAAMLRDAGHQVTFFDSMLADGVEEYERKLAAAKPQLVLIYEDTFNFLSKMCLAAMRQAACEMIAGRRCGGARTIVAGPDVTDSPAPYLRAGADLALSGEGLPTLLHILSRLDQRVDAPTALVGQRPIRRLIVESWKSTGCFRRTSTAGISGGSARRVGSGRHGSVSRCLDEGARLFQLEHGGVSRLLVPLRLVRQAHLAINTCNATQAKSRRNSPS